MMSEDRISGRANSLDVRRTSSGLLCAARALALPYWDIVSGFLDAVLSSCIAQLLLGCRHISPLHLCLPTVSFALCGVSISLRCSDSSDSPGVWTWFYEDKVEEGRVMITWLSFFYDLTTSLPHHTHLCGRVSHLPTHLFPFSHWVSVSLRCSDSSDSPSIWTWFSSSSFHSPTKFIGKILIFISRKRMMNTLFVQVF